MALSQEEKDRIREERNAAWDKIKELVFANPEYTDSLKVLRPSLYGIIGPRGKAPRHLEIIGYITAQGAVDEDTLFAEFKVGRRETSGMIRRALREAAPEDRKWISFDEESGTYTLEGEGAEPPVSWEGYVPVDMSTDLDNDDDEM
jgi:hypothetical protein